MRILVLGGTNFIGPQAVRWLVEMGHEVTLFHRGNHESPFLPDVPHIHGDRRQFADHLGEFRALRPDVVLDMMVSTEAGGRTLMETFRGIARRVVAISSADVYRAYDRFRRVDPGRPDPSPLTEDSPLRDRLYPYKDENTKPEEFGYHYDKILMERQVMSDPELPGTILRLPMVYGPGDYQHRLHTYLKRMDDGRPAIILSEEMAAWQGLRGYVEDVGKGIALCASDARAAGRIYHIADRAITGEKEWVLRIGRAAGWKGEVITLPNEQLPEEMRDPYDLSQDWALDSTRIRSELGYSEPTDPEEAMRRTVEWERAHPPQQVDPQAFDYEAEDRVIEMVS